MTDSASVLAALTDSLMDVTTSIINLIAIKIALQPADEDHRFGHGKAESLAGLAQAAFITGSAVFLMFNGIAAFIHGHQMTSSHIGIVVMIFSVVITLVLVLFQNYVVKKTGSLAIKADSLHYRTDIALNGAVLFAIVLSGLGWYWVDAIFSIIVSFYILYGAWEIGFQSINALMDKQLSNIDQARIIKAVNCIDGVRGMHDLRTRQSGNVKFIQLHLELDDDQTLFDAHKKSEQLELILEKAFLHSDILIHLDPLSIVPLNKRNNYAYEDRSKNLTKDR